ncbi:MAG: hypothetical protein HPM95_16855 [Alphaproteobacteria bacterium]|nr:hypothetical protein [Alphaproteobacteria bacterium]
MAEFDLVALATVGRFAIIRETNGAASDDQIAFCLGREFTQVLIKAGEWNTAYSDAENRLFPEVEKKTITELYREYEDYPSVALNRIRRHSQTLPGRD